MNSPSPLKSHPLLRQEATPTGAVILMLHAHLPFVHHPEHDDFLEEDWLYEAISETYLPLLSLLEDLAQQQAPVTLTMSMSPTLCSMLRTPLLQERFMRRLERLCALATLEQTRAESTPQERSLAAHYLMLYQAQREAFVGYEMDLVSAFSRLQQAGVVEICTCAATHGFLPLMAHHPEAMKAQIDVAVDHYIECFGQGPRGIWLPECGYTVEVEKYLRRRGIRYFFLDSHGVEQARPTAHFGVYAPVFTHYGMAVFARDQESSRQVWSAKDGYPGDTRYRDFYRDIGFDRPMEYIRPFVQPTGERKMTGMKYHRVTGETEDKEWYDVDAAKVAAHVHAYHFVQARRTQLQSLSQKMSFLPVVTCPYDAELFGHWWFEGPLFLEAVLSHFAAQEEIVCCSPTQYLLYQSRLQMVEPSFSSWGAQGYAQVWLEPSNDWIYPLIEDAVVMMLDAARRYPDATGLHKACLDQMSRELLLAQSSDWAFLIQTGSAVHYATKRVKEHIEHVERLYRALCADEIDEVCLSLLQRRDAIFPDIDYRVYLPE